MTFQDQQLNSMTSQAWKMKCFNSKTLPQYEPCNKQLVPNLWSFLRNEGAKHGMLSIAKLINIKVLLHQFSNLMFNLHYMCLFS